MDHVENCPFCNPSERILKENDHAIVLLSNPHKVPGHLLVIPKRHVVQPWDLLPQEIVGIFDLIFDIERKILGKLGDGVDIRQNYRPFLEQNDLKVDHVVFHVIPRSLDDYLYKVSEQYERELFAELDAVEADEVAKILK
jgi:diadenosine tetraphosphate (Ap4A) HIT family hydrolase